MLKPKKKLSKLGRYLKTYVLNQKLCYLFKSKYQAFAKIIVESSAKTFHHIDHMGKVKN